MVGACCWLASASNTIIIFQQIFEWETSVKAAVHIAAGNSAAVISTLDRQLSGLCNQLVGLWEYRRLRWLSVKPGHRQWCNNLLLYTRVGLDLELW